LTEELSVSSPAPPRCEMMCQLLNEDTELTTFSFKVFWDYPDETEMLNDATETKIGATVEYYMKHK